MDFPKSFKSQIFDIKKDTFDHAALEVFHYQYYNNKVYKKFCDYSSKNTKTVKNVKDIPFIPIEFFKNHVVKSGEWEAEKIFKSSGTTSSSRSHHHIKDVDFYLRNSINIFNSLVGSLSEYQLIALLPSYQEQADSSLICMVDFFMKKSNNNSDYYMVSDIKPVLQSDKKKLLIGVSYAILDIAEKNIVSNNTLVIETGGMKGRKKEITRKELHEIIKDGLNPKEIWSEYGMTELMSQAYGKGGFFSFPNWAKALTRDINDPFCYLGANKTGGLNIIDLANVDTCSFIETKDLGRANGDLFEVLGRFDNSDIRGCNLMV